MCKNCEPKAKLARRNAINEVIPVLVGFNRSERTKLVDDINLAVQLTLHHEGEVPLRPEEDTPWILPGWGVVGVTIHDPGNIDAPRS